MSANSSITVSSWLHFATGKLHAANIPTDRLDALVLLADEIHHDKAWILAHPEHTLQIEQIEKLSTKIVQRARHMPLAYIRGYAEFYGRNFTVNQHVLVPRPESESMIELLKRYTKAVPKTIIDIGTGSGCLAITAKLELPHADVYAVDIDKACLHVAAQNAEKLAAQVTFLHGAFLQPLKHSRCNLHGSIILANLPYVPQMYPINEAATHEPALALFSGDDGLDHYRQLFSELSSLTDLPEAIITESLTFEQGELSRLARQHGFACKASEGLAQIFIRR